MELRQQGAQRHSHAETLTLSEEESGTLGGGILVRHHMQLLRKHRRSTEELAIDCQSQAQIDIQGKSRTTPTSVSGCFSAMELKTRSQLGLPK